MGRGGDGGRVGGMEGGGGGGGEEEDKERSRRRGEGGRRGENLKCVATCSLAPLETCVVCVRARVCARTYVA